MGLGDTPDGRVPPSPNVFQKSPHTTSVELDPAAQAKQRRLIEDGLARVAAAREQIASTPAHLTDDAATTSLEALLDEIISKQAALKEEQQALGINTPHTPDLTSPFATTRLLPSNTPPAERRLYFEQALANMEQTLLEMRDNLEHHAEIAVPSSESGRHSGTEESVELDDVSTETDEDDPMSPRGIYMRRCAPLTPEELEAEKESWKPYKRKSRIDFLGLTLFILFILATGFYAYTRIIFSLRALGPLLAYGIFILVLELTGAISIIFYGVWLIAVTDNSDIHPLGTEGMQLRRQYHVRVLVPCYKESLAIVRRTIIAARKATRPKGCAVTIYLCDDGRKREKRQWVKSLEADDVIYVTGRPKGKGKTTNGKSENLNYSLRLIYPKKPDPGEQPNIPLTELMCLFDADQTCSVSFFENLLRYIDSGDDVAVALSPQLMHNIQPDCDIFNHQNVHFWEKMQPGMDALGFISLTGTNMILRSRALQACDWFPTESVTEDWELGMRMKKLNWKCRYVPEYCAIGEAPEEVRNAFQQRSRWCKGHFQTFWSKQCPLVDSKLGIFYRLTYSSTCLSYISAGISVPVMTLVPIVTLLFGYFPINLNFWTVVGITVYYVVLNMLTYYCTSLKHFTALWLSNMATTIMFWPFLKAALFTPIKSCLGQGLTFKSTQKGSQTAGASLKELGPSIILVILSLLALIVGFTNFNVNVNAPKAIALCWVIFNLIPHTLLLIYARFGQGNFLTIVCKIFMLLSSFVGLLALVLLWLLYPREENYTRAADLSLRYLEAQRSGQLPDNYNIPFRFTSGLQNVDTLSVKGSPYKAPVSVPVDVSGGFYNEGEVGPVKITFNVALTTTMLAWSLLDFEDFWRRDPARLNAALELVNHGMQYIDSCYIPNPNPVNASSPNVGDGDIFVYLVGDIITERTVWRRPEDIVEVQPIMYVTGIESPSDLASQISATLSSTILALYQYGVVDAESTQAQVSKAAALFKSAYDSPGMYTDLLNVTATGLDDHYDSTSASDDLFWAATWIFRATTMNFRSDLRDLYYQYMQILKGDAYADLDIMAVTPDYMNNVAVIHAAVITRDDDFHSTAQSFLWDWICSGVVKYTTFGRGYYFKSPMLGSTVTAAALAAVYVYKVRNMDGFSVSQDFKDGFYCFAEAQGRYMLGTGFRKPMVIGFNKRTYRKTWDRSATCPTYPEACDASYLLADRNDFNPENGALLWAPSFTDTINNRRGGNQTVISLENNWGMALLWPGLELKGEPYMRCLQGQGAFLKHPVCKHKRPNAERGGPTEAPTVMAPEFQGLWKPATRPPTAPSSPPRAAG